MGSVDRPSPIDYIHPDGREAMIDFEWGDPADPIPKGLRITVKYAVDNIHNFHEKAIYKSFEDARKQGVKLATTMIDQADRL